MSFCRRCEVLWRGDRPCWVCSGPGTDAYNAKPITIPSANLSIDVRMWSNGAANRHQALEEGWLSDSIALTVEAGR